MTARRALTLVELLAALALLSAIAAAALAVIRSATRTASTAAATTSWQRAADSLLASIAADLSSGDFDLIGDLARGDPRVDVDEIGAATVLSIRTRDPFVGACRRTYVFHAATVQVETAPLTSTPNHARPSGAGTFALAGLSGAMVNIEDHHLNVCLAGPGNIRRAAVFPLEQEPAP